MPFSPSERYNPSEAEARWQSVWAEQGIFETANDDPRPKYYVLEMFPYPSGRILIGHVRNYAMGDVVARFMPGGGLRMTGVDRMIDFVSTDSRQATPTQPLLAREAQTPRPALSARR